MKTVVGAGASTRNQSSSMGAAMTPHVLRPGMGSVSRLAVSFGSSSSRQGSPASNEASNPDEPGSSGPASPASKLPVAPLDPPLLVLLTTPLEEAAPLDDALVAPLLDVEPSRSPFEPPP